MSMFISNVPIWVFPLFIALLILGVRASKDRNVPIALICLLPLLAVPTLRNIYALSPTIWVWFIAAFAYICGILLGMKLQRAWILERRSRVVTVKGEWATMTAMMIIFAAGFVNGFLSYVLPDLTHTTLFAVAFVIATCIPSGQFLGRTIATLRAPLT